MTDSVNIVHWNCQGFNAHGPEYIWSLSKQKHIPDIICLQETFFLNEKDHPDITGFILANFSTRNIKRGGTAIDWTVILCFDWPVVYEMELSDWFLFLYSDWWMSDRLKYSYSVPLRT
jgi:hypothetical protein